MQLSARILTALAVLAFVVGVAVGTKGATDDVSAATGTIDALNVGTCTTTNADDFALGDCTQPDAFFQQVPLEDLIEVDTLYATYAHDPSTAAEAPRAILTDGDLLMISITDTGRDRRDPVLVSTAQNLTDGVAPTGQDGVLDANDGTTIMFNLRAADPEATPVVTGIDAKAIVAEAVGLAPEDEDDLPAFEQQVEFDGGTDINNGNDLATYTNSGTYEIIWERDAGTEEDDFKPIAPDGVVKFFGRVNPGGTDAAYGPFGDIGANISLDEDVISGEPNEPPVMTLNISVPDAQNAAVQIQVIYYETSGIEFILGGETCVDDPHLSTEPGEEREFATAACTSDETEADETKDQVNDAFVLHAESDEDAAEDKKQLALIETGRFTGIFQGSLRLTDADGDGGDPAINWGRTKADGEYTLADSVNDVDASASKAVLGVGNGPVTITYKDTDGKNKTFQVEIDITAPTITVDSPAHQGRSDDEKPSFIGTFNDADSGLQANSFQLDVDNTRDDGDDRSRDFHRFGRDCRWASPPTAGLQRFCN